VTVAVIQPGTPQTEKWNAVMGVAGETDQQQQERFQRTDKQMRDDALRLIQQQFTSPTKPQLYVLPETTFLSAYFVYQSDLHEYLHALSKNLNADIFFGADNRMRRDEYFRHEQGSSSTLPQMPTRTEANGTTTPDWEREQSDIVNFNSAWMVTPEHGLQPAAYNKLQLVPFGEMVPFIGHFQWFQRLAIAGSFYPGLDTPLFESHGVKFGSVICFESAFPSLTSALARKEAQMICVLTNDAWYDPKYLIEQGGFWGTLFKVPFLRGLAAAGPNQHFAHSVFRAIETRLPIVRSANTGISAVISPTGEIERSLPYSSAGQFVFDVAAPKHPPTFYVRHGDWFAWLSLVVLIGHLAWMVWEYRFGTAAGRKQQIESEAASG
jgi:apolipoprotein N-acyltransferase